MGRCGAPSSFCQFAQQSQKLRALGAAEPGRHAPLVRFDPAQQPAGQGFASACEPKAIRAPVFPAPSLHEPGAFERVNDAHHRGAIQIHRVRETALCHAGIGVEQE